MNIYHIIYDVCLICRERKNTIFAVKNHLTMIPLFRILIGWSKPLLLFGPPPDRRRAALLTMPLPVLCLFPGGGRLLRRFLQLAPTFILLLRFVSPLLFVLVLLLALLRPLLCAFGFLLPPPSPPLPCPPLLPPFPGGAMIICLLDVER